MRPHVRVNTSVSAARWDDGGSFWEMTLGDGSRLRADVVVAGTGMFGPLSYPAIEGRERFAGNAFHTGAWPGDHDLRGQRVAVIGSAGTAVQLVPAIAAQVSQLHLFQRSANWVLPKADTPFTAEELGRFASDQQVLAGERAKFLEYYGSTAPYADAQRRADAEQQCLAQIAAVDDPELRARLTPTSPWGCQRPLFSNDYYPVFNLPHVELVTDPITAIDERGVITADGRHREVDTIIYATGYETTRFASVVDFVGRGGVRLDDAWIDGARAYLGITMSGFPNLFFLYGPNTNHGSIIFMLECQAAYIARTVGRLEHDDLAWVDVRPEVLDEYDADVQRAVEEITVWNSGCHHYYRVGSGRIVTQWPYSMYRYREMTEAPDPDDAYETALIER